MNWKELKEFCNSLNDEQLENKVVLWREDEAIINIEAEILSEDHYNYEDCEGLVTRSEAEEMARDEFEFPNGMDDFRKVYSKGDPILWEEF